MEPFQLLHLKLCIGVDLESDLITEAIVLHEFEQFVNASPSGIDYDEEYYDTIDDDASRIDLLEKAKWFSDNHDNQIHAKRLRDSLYLKRDLTRRLVELLPE